MGEGLAQRNKTEKLTVAALLTAVFAVTALLFKGFVIIPIPSITELRPVNASVSYTHLTLPTKLEV